MSKTSKMRFFALLLMLVLIGCVKCIELDSFYKYLNEENSTSTAECDKQKDELLKALFAQDLWALKMLDASGRIPQALTQGNRLDLGNFDQCLNIHEKLDTGDINGRYCFSGLIIPIISSDTALSSAVSPFEVVKRQVSKVIEPREESTNDSDGFSVAVCIPDACYPSDFYGLLGVDFLCQTKNESNRFTGGVIAFLVFLAVFAVIIIASTSYDIYLQRYKKESKHEILLAFSFYTNGKKILKTTKQGGQIPYFNGLKVISMFWVILGHRYAVSETFVTNLEDAQDFRRKWYSVYVLCAPLAVDTFLFVSGALMSYAFLKTMRKPDRPKFNVLLYYFHRYLRLTPALAVVYFAQMTIIPKIVTGPMNDLMFEQSVNPPCEKNWWSLFLYIQNYVATDDMCLLHTWYLSLDMQLFLVSPLILLPMVYYGKKVSYVGIPILVIITIMYTMLIFYLNDIRMWSDDYYNLFYYVTHTRTSPWLIGIAFGAFILDYQADEKKYQIKSKILLLAIWGMAFAVTAVLLFSQDDVDNNHTTLKSTFYFPLQRPIWAIFLCWISYCCMSGNAGFINSFLSAPIFQVLAKITYSTYLIHIPLLFVHVGAMRTIPYFYEYDAFRTVLSDICIAYAIGALWTLAFESPIIIIEKIIFGGGRKPRQKKEDIDQNTGINERYLVTKNNV